MRLAAAGVGDANLAAMWTYPATAIGGDPYDGERPRSRIVQPEQAEWCAAEAMFADRQRMDDTGADTGAHLEIDQTRSRGPVGSRRSQHEYGAIPQRRRAKALRRIEWPGMTGEGQTWTGDRPGRCEAQHGAESVGQFA